MFNYKENRSQLGQRTGLGKRKEEERQKIKDKDCNLGMKALPYARKGEASCRKDVRMEKRKRKEEDRKEEVRIMKGS